MARKGKTGVLKRLREVKKAEKAALKREEMKLRKENPVAEEEPDSDRIATQDDMAGYGFPSADEPDSSADRDGG
jgi:hypothetical protein